MNARCDVCGSPVRRTHENAFLCVRDPQHGIAFGGAGSGWHAEQGHIKHADAAKAHTAAAAAHAASSKDAEDKTRVAARATQATGASNHFSNKAAQFYAKQGNHAEAAKYHTAMANAHAQMAKVTE